MLNARAREELRGWKAEIVRIDRAIDGVINVKTLPGFFNTRDEALAAAQSRIDRKTAAPAVVTDGALVTASTDVVTEFSATTTEADDPIIVAFGDTEAEEDD